jgi:single-stranded DNA-binding protein
VPNINRVVLEGELLADPVMDGGCCRLTMLVVTMRKEIDGWVGRPNQFEIVAWGTAAEEAMTGLRPGHPVGIEGELAWESEELPDRTRRQHVWIVADKVRALDVRAATLIPPPAAAPTAEEATSADEMTRERAA